MEEKTFYVCSYGGSGSTVLSKALKSFGKVEHIHSRNPPDKLEYVGNNNGGNAYIEWFNGITIPENELKNYIVIYIYRNPSFSIPSRFIENPGHLHNVQLDPTIKVEEVLSTGKDLYKIRQFYDNYMKPNEKRNYKIYCIKYEDLNDKQDELSDILGIGKLNLNIWSNRKYDEKLASIYADLIDEMNKNKFITIS